MSERQLVFGVLCFWAVTAFGGPYLIHLHGQGRLRFGVRTMLVVATIFSAMLGLIFYRK